MFTDWRIGLVGPLPPPAGGMAMQTSQLSDLLMAEGAHVCVVQTNRPYRPTWIGHVPMVRAAGRLVAHVASLWRLACRSDVIHVMANSGWSWHLFAAPAVWIASWRRVPVVVNYRGGEAESFLMRRAAIVRLTMNRASALVVPSGFLLDVFDRYGMAALVVPNVVDLDQFRPGEVRSGPPRILVARAFEAIYDIETAVRAFAILLTSQPEATMTIAGTGPTEGAVRALASELHVAHAIRFPGRLSRAEIASELRKSTVSLNPSLVDNTPNSVLEALASGVPVVSTNVGGVTHIVRHGESALLVEAGDASAMALAMLRLSQEPGLAARLARAGLREIDRYAWKNVAPLLADVYRQTNVRFKRAG